MAPGVAIPAAELRWHFTRAGGPGGQHVNTSSTRVQLTWDLAGSDVLDPTQRSRARRRLAGQIVDGAITVTAAESRSQKRNRDLARQRLAELVAGAIAPPPPPRRATRPTKASQVRRVDTKVRRAETKRLRRRVTGE